jgi:hypothetical protein
MYSSRGWSYSASTSSPSPSSSTDPPQQRRRFGIPRPRLPGPLPIAVVVVGAVAWYHFAFQGFAIPGTVVDISSGQPVAGVRVWSSHASATTDAQGHFVLNGIKPPEVISFDVAGYTSSTARAQSPFESVSVALQPVALDLFVSDADTGKPLGGASVGDQTLLADGHLHVAPILPDARFHVTASGYAPADVTYAGQSTLRVSLAPRLAGRVTDARTGKPLANARVSVGDTVLRTNDNGEYELPRSISGNRLFVLLPGYRRGELDLSQRPSLDVALQPNEVHGIYMTYFAIGGDDYRDGMYQLLDTTEVNAVVIDVKGDYGLLSYHSNVPLAEAIGANDNPTIDDLDDLLRSLHEHGAYVIARIDVFKDNMLARNGPRTGLDLAIKDRRTGGLWIDGEKLSWVDGFQPAAWDYNVALAREAIERGFDEVQFDYVRFATDPSPGSSIDDIVYSKPFTEENRVDALHQLLQKAHAAVNAAGGYLGIDTFGYTTWWENDGGIGQDLRVLADDIDYYCPMVYPSTFSAGVPGLVPYPGVVSRPYDVVYLSLTHVQDKLLGKQVVVRPWLQYFDDYPWATRTRYDAPQIEAQKQAASEANAGGWMLWNPGSLFRRGGLAPKQVAVQPGG